MIVPSRLLLIVASVVLAYASDVNRTIDDDNGDSMTGALPTYFPQNVWNRSPQICNIPPCGINVNNVDVSKVFDGTWHDTTYQPLAFPDGVSIEVTFTGTAVYVYNLVANTLSPTTITFTNLTFSIDGELVGQYIHQPDQSATVQTSVLVFHRLSLPNEAHTLIIRASGSTPSLVLFDYIEYTQDAESPSLSSSAIPDHPLPTSHPSSPTNPQTLASSKSPQGATDARVQASSTVSSPSTTTSGLQSPITGHQPEASSFVHFTLATTHMDTASLQPSLSPSPSSTETDAADARGPPSLSTGAVGGIVAGIVTAFSLASFLFCLLRRRRPVKVRRGKKDAVDSSVLDDGDSSSAVEVASVVAYPLQDSDTITRRSMSLAPSAHATVGVYVPSHPHSDIARRSSLDRSAKGPEAGLPQSRSQAVEEREKRSHAKTLLRRQERSGQGPQEENNWEDWRNTLVEEVDMLEALRGSSPGVLGDGLH